MNFNLTKKQKKGILAGVAILFFLIYVSLCFNNNVWTDESFTIDLLKLDFLGILDGTASDVHPPLYYLIAKCFVLVFGDSLLSLKMVSIIPMILCMTWGAAIVWKRFDFHTALLFQIILGVIPCTMEYAVQIRMYAWAVFFVTFMALWAYEAFLEGKWQSFAGVILTSVAAAYTHYFAFVSAILIYGFLFLALAFRQWKQLWKWLVSVIVSLLLFTPWMPYMKIQVKGVSKDYWISEITGETIKDFFPFLFDMDIPYSTAIWMLLILAGIILAVIMICKKEKKEGTFALLLLAVPVFTAVTGVVASALIRPIFIVRYLLPCMGVTALFLAITLSRFACRELYLTMLVFFLCVGAVDYKEAIYLEYKWTHTSETEAFLAEHVKENDIIAYNYEIYKLIYDYYWEDDTEKVLWMDIDLENNAYDTIWLLDTIYWPTPTDEYLAGYGWQKTYMGNYGIEHNDFKIYKIERCTN